MEVVPSLFEERLDKNQEPWRYVEETALGKAKDVASRLQDRQDWAVVIGADTVVVRPHPLWCHAHQPYPCCRCWTTGYWRSQAPQLLPWRC